MVMKASGITDGRIAYLPRRKRKLAVVSAFALISFIICLFGCSAKDQSIQFLAAFGLKGIDSSKIIRTSSNPALNSDYSNKVYYVTLRFGKAEFDQFVKENGFQEDLALVVPTKGNGSQNMPGWWDAPSGQENQFSKRNGSMRISLVWASDKMFLYGHD